MDPRYRSNFLLDLWILKEHLVSDSLFAEDIFG